MLDTHALQRNGDRPTPIVLGAGINALGIVRALNEGGLKSIVLCASNDVACFSRYATPLTFADPQKSPELFANEVSSLAAALPAGGIIFATSDAYLKALIPARPALEAAGLVFPMPAQSAMELFASKNLTMDLARTVDVGIPRSVNTMGRDILAAAKEVVFPAILKPEETVGFQAAFQLKRQTLVVENESGVPAVMAMIQAAGWQDRSFVLQEFIPGPSSNLYTISTFSDREGKIWAYSTGHKLAQYPTEAGTICRGRVVPVPELLAPTERLFKATQFCGVANTEYKFDPRDSTYKLMEVNPRPGKWNSSATRTGVNLPLHAYRYFIEGKTPPTTAVSDEIAIWTAWSDFAIALAADNGVIGMFRRLAHEATTAKGRGIAAVTSLKDPLPAVWSAGDLAGKAIRKVFGA